MIDPDNPLAGIFTEKVSIHAGEYSTVIRCPRAFEPTPGLEAAKLAEIRAGLERRRTALSEIACPAAPQGLIAGAVRSLRQALGLG